MEEATLLRAEREAVRRRQGGLGAGHALGGGGVWGAWTSEVPGTEATWHNGSVTEGLQVLQVLQLSFK